MWQSLSVCLFVAGVIVLPCSAQRNNAQVIADSLINLKQKELILSPEDDPHVSAELRRQGAELEPSKGAELEPSQGVEPEQPQGKKRPEQPQKGAELDQPREEEEEEELKTTKKAKQEDQDDDDVS